jgi:hypothetical protein
MILVMMMAEILAFLTRKCCKIMPKLDLIIVFFRKAPFFSLKLVIITLTPGIKNVYILTYIGRYRVFKSCRINKNS